MVREHCETQDVLDTRSEMPRQDSRVTLDGRLAVGAAPSKTIWMRAACRRAPPLLRNCGSAFNSPCPKRANTCPAVEPIVARGFFSHAHAGAMHQRMTSMERAFHLARSGRFTTLTEVVTTLDREGYSANQIQGPLLKRQLTGLIKAARPEPLDRDLSRGVRGN